MLSSLRLVIFESGNILFLFSFSIIVSSVFSSLAPSLLIKPFIEKSFNFDFLMYSFIITNSTCLYMLSLVFFSVSFLNIFLMIGSGLLMSSSDWLVSSFFGFVMILVFRVIVPFFLSGFKVMYFFCVIVYFMHYCLVGYYKE